MSMLGLAYRLGIVFLSLFREAKTYIHPSLNVNLGTRMTKLPAWKFFLAYFKKVKKANPSPYRIYIIKDPRKVNFAFSKVTN